MDLAHRIRAARSRAGLTQERLAELVGVSASAVWQWESPKHRSQPGIDRLPRICDVLGVTLDELLREKISAGVAESSTASYAAGSTSEISPAATLGTMGDLERRLLLAGRQLKGKQLRELIQFLETL